MIDKSQAGHPYIKGTAVPADRGDLDFTASTPLVCFASFEACHCVCRTGIGVGRLYKAAFANWRQTKHREYDFRMKSITHARV
jgi:hypothetical protein